eukprot:TRINITY_DN7134_c0_g2_i1.p1 TRINITY_DN7134_c0_g2~~TRINITY_DN7134_c0_g2_i1.p1  ORF type:complete len:294 (-),score=34.72 TRINITY_DN7134_c0_g2_i1:694-1575(-)
MAHAHNVEVKNTFIHVVEEDKEEDVQDASSTRTRKRGLTDSMLLLGVVDSSGLGEADGSKNELCVLESPRPSFDHADFDAYFHPEKKGSAKISQQQAVKTLAISEHLEVPSEWQGKTSVMVRHISYRCTRFLFCNQLDNSGFQDLYDYVYVPVNTVRGTSKGYAFVNFVDDCAAFKFKLRFDGRLMDAIPGGNRRVEVLPANLQGYAENSAHYISKQSEVSASPSAFPAKSSQISTKASEDDKRSKIIHGDESPKQAVDIERSKKQPTRSICRHCQGHVLAKARFCSWCGKKL